MNQVKRLFGEAKVTATISPIPPPSKQKFRRGINHPELYLWDAWSYSESNTIHLYCLAVSRTKQNGQTLIESERNDFPFHVRHFSSQDNAQTWTDEGCFQTPGNSENGHDARNIWSGSIAPMPDGTILVAYTGLYQVSKERTFLQNIALALSSDGNSADWLDSKPISCPIRDREKILKLGYYLDDAERLGHKSGEQGGPVMSWRDPFIFCDNRQDIHLIWAAKSAPRKGVIAHCLLARKADGYHLEKLFPPVSLPDENLFTQAELPKIYHDDAKGIYYLIISTCNRISEGQADEDIDKTLRLYKSDSLSGPWEWVVNNKSAISGTRGLFGMTVLKTDFKNNRVFCISPLIGVKQSSTSLSFSAPFYLDLTSNSIDYSFN